MKFFSAVILAGGVLFSTSTISAATGPFTDVSWEHPSAFAINYLKQQQIIQGYNDHTYRPESLINRAELIKIIIERNYSSEEIDSCTQSSFSDVLPDAWYAPYICTAVQNNLVKGYPDGTFGPGKNINFVEASKIVYLAYGQTDQVGDPWYRPYVVFLHTNKAIPSSLSKLDETINRGEMAEMIYRLRHFAEQPRNITPKVKPTQTKDATESPMELVETNTKVNSSPPNVDQTIEQPTLTPEATGMSPVETQATFQNPETTAGPEHFGSESEDNDTDYYYKHVDIQGYCPPFYQCTEVLAFYRDGRVKLQLGDDERWARGDTSAMIEQITNADLFNKSCPIEGFSNAAKTHFLSYNGQTRKFYDPECANELDPIKAFVRSYFPADEE